jgi:hypothetical protein
MLARKGSSSAQLLSRGPGYPAQCASSGVQTRCDGNKSEVPLHQSLRYELPFKKFLSVLAGRSITGIAPSSIAWCYDEQGATVSHSVNTSGTVTVLNR